MLRKLRWKFIFLIMALLAVVLGTALAVQTASAARQYRDETDRVLRWVLQRGESLTDPGRPQPSGELHQDGELYTLIPAFYAVLDSRGRVVLAVSYNAEVDEEDVARAVAAALAAGRTECPALPAAETLRVLRAADALRALWGVRYPGEA